MSDDAISFYAEHADMLADRYDAVPVEAHFAPVRALLPDGPAHVLDIGAGTGRDARWLADLGHTVTATEPVAGFFEKARTTDSRVTWLQDGLPDLPALSKGAARFDLITLSGVWHHVAPADLTRAAASISRLLAPSGLLLMSLRSGPSHPGLPVYPVDATDTAKLFTPHALLEHARIPAPSLQQTNRDAGVTWTWLALRRTGAPT
ncbi:methyltransferase domain-containing protein [Rhodobacteraceae bacterium D3-12]|nr:methyltransferase domain-containing protein [Rhodobacteraceae bacterium D3-12]